MFVCVTGMCIKYSIFVIRKKVEEESIQLLLESVLILFTVDFR